MWLFLIFLFFVFFGAWAASDDPDICCFGGYHEYEYDGDSFTPDDQHYGRYYICNKCGHEHFISYKDWRDMRDIYPEKFIYWKNRPYSQTLKNYIKERKIKD